MNILSNADHQALMKRYHRLSCYDTDFVLARVMVDQDSDDRDIRLLTMIELMRLDIVYLEALRAKLNEGSNGTQV